VSAFSELDRALMARALALAHKGLFTTTPNPRVGCVIARGQEVVGEGWHQKAGDPHAEADALVQASGAAQGATAYVTLEPCNHHGRTPPCAESLIKAGVARVVAAMQDPNAKSNSGGRALAAAGVRDRSPGACHHRSPPSCRRRWDRWR
jgi:diaminohydroxyphosphoribosylaminopyrimidine deaminase/5-amino-6-(5-phosphoribosylamino)uracil reductase